MLSHSHSIPIEVPRKDLATDSNPGSDHSALLPQSRMSIRHKLPLLICSLLMAVVIAYSWAVYSESKRGALGAARERLRGVTRQLSGLMETSARQWIAETRDIAKRRPIIEYLQSSSPASQPEALKELASIPRQNESVRVELWNPDGTARLGVGGEVPPIQASRAQEIIRCIKPENSAGIGPFHVMGDKLQYPIIAAVRDGAAILGYVVQRRRLAASARTTKQLGELIGSDQAALFIGNVQGGLWTDLVTIAAPPPVPIVAGDDRLLEYDRPQTGARLAATAAVPGTPWVLLVEYPRSHVLARAKLVSKQLGLIGLVFLVVGGTGAWLLSRNLTRPLSELGSAASAIATGDYERRLRVEDGDEFGRLCAAFNTMAHNVQESRAQLQEKIIQLGAAADLYRRLFENNPHPMWVYDVDSLAFIAVNGASVQHYGYSLDEFLSMTIKDIRPPEDLPALLDHVREDHPVVEKPHLWRHLKKDGTIIHVEVSTHRLEVEGRRARLVLALDVTKRRQAEEGIRRLNAELEKRVTERTAELEAANRELEAFSYSVSHDLRAPLRSIDGFSLALIEEYSQVIDGPGLDYLRRLRSSSQRMADLIDDLLNLSRVTRSEIHREPVDLSSLAFTISDELSRTGSTREVDFVIAPGIIAEGDRRLLRVVLENLLGNSWKFTGKHPHARIEFGVMNQAEERVYFVRDDGAGFDMTYVHKLFGPFQRLHAADEFEGTGIGLATVQRIIHRHGGRVWAEGMVGSGATFSFTL